jgi:hypothetical protein
MIVADMTAPPFTSLRYKYDIKKSGVKVSSPFGDAERSVIHAGPTYRDKVG